MSAPRYHPDEANEAHPQREAFRSGNTAGHAKRALAMKAARKYIVEHPGCRFSDIQAATHIKHSALLQLCSMGLLRFTQQRQPDGGDLRH